MPDNVLSSPASSTCAAPSEPDAVNVQDNDVPDSAFEPVPSGAITVAFLPAILEI